MRKMRTSREQRRVVKHNQVSESLNYTPRPQHSMGQPALELGQDHRELHQPGRGGRVIGRSSRRHSLERLRHRRVDRRRLDGGNKKC